MNSKLLVGLISLCFLFFSCAKEEEEKSQPSSIPVATNPEIMGSDGVFLSTREFELIPPLNLPSPVNEEGWAEVIFYTVPLGSPPQSGPVLLDAGDVFCNGIKLKQDVILPGWPGEYWSTQNLNLKGNTTWNIQGSASVLPFIHTVTTGYPYISEVKGPDTLLSKGMDFTVYCDTLTLADSVTFDFGDLVITKHASNLNHTFKDADMDFPYTPPGTVSQKTIVIRAYTHSAILVNGKKYYFQNSSYRTKKFWVKGV